MAHRHFREDALKSGTAFGRLGAVALVLIDRENPFARPAQRHRAMNQCVLALARFAMVQHLMRAGLSHVDDRQPVQMVILNLG